ncbi:MAG: hypothetical protein ABJO09_05100 [Hyphomicrobiales bacterium]
MAKEPRTECRTPTPDKSSTTIPTWKYEVLETAILQTVDEAGHEGLLFSDLPENVRDKLSSDALEKMGSLGWHVTTVKLELEVRGVLKRLDGVKPQRLVLG